MSKIQRCICITHADEYDFPKVKGLFPKSQTFDHEKEALLLKIDKGHALVFKFGCVVFWDIPEETRQQILKTLESCTLSLYPQEKETYPFKFGKGATVISDGITLLEDETLPLQLLTVSYALAQSLKLAVFEERVASMIEKTRSIPKQLAQRGKISIRNKEINKSIGSLLMAKHTINIHSDILDTPNFLWENPEFEPLYTQTTNDQDLSSRLHVLNTRLDIVQDLFHLLGEELKNRHSFFIEITIVLLITIEVVISVVTHFFSNIG